MMHMTAARITIDRIRLVAAPSLGRTGWGLILTASDQQCPIAQLEVYTSQARTTAPTMLDAELLLQFIRTVLPDPTRVWLRDAFGEHSVDSSWGPRTTAGLVGDVDDGGGRSERLAVYARYRLPLPVEAMNEPVELLVDVLPLIDASGARFALE